MKSVICLAVVALLLTACGKKADDNMGFPVYEKKQEASAPVVTKEQLAYYRAHLDEALDTWHKCQEKGLLNLTDSERTICRAAQTIWESQPYKAGSKK